MTERFGKSILFGFFGVALLIIGTIAFLFDPGKYAHLRIGDKTWENNTGQPIRPQSVRTTKISF
jgi:hypothetical protein